MQQNSLTQLLVNWSQGDEKSRNELVALVEPELRLIAKRYLIRERPDHTLQATALINEAYLRLIDQQNVEWQNRAHFFAIAAQMMRRILVDHAKTRNAAKRGGEWQKLPLDEALDLQNHQDRDWVALDDALKELAARDPERSRIVELRFFGGLSIEETAAVLGISIDAVKAHWRVAKAWLYREMTKAE